MEKDIVSVLNQIQVKLNVPKGQFNKFANFKYRSCEDNLEAIKPYLKEHKAILVLTDDLVLIGDRYYVKATAMIKIGEGQSILTHGWARETATKKGMDESQITGSASSYARKFALNGMFCIDDTKDADTRNNEPEPKAELPKPKNESNPASTKQVVEKSSDPINPQTEWEKENDKSFKIVSSNEVYTLTELAKKNSWSKKDFEEATVSLGYHDEWKFNRQDYNTLMEQFTKKKPVEADKND